MPLRKVSINQIIENQIPEFVRDEYPLFVQFIKQYYASVGSQGQPIDILENLDSYIDLDSLYQYVDSTILTSDITKSQSKITVTSTEGFPNSYGLIKIDNEIISYEYKDDTAFYKCSRGFSGISGYTENSTVSNLIFESTSASSHTSQSKVENLSLIFLKQFVFKIKKQFSPGFEGRGLDSNLREETFIKNITDFYSSKGTDSAFKILFKAVYNKPVTIIRPRDFTISASTSGFKTTEKLVVKELSGDPVELLNRTLFQVEDDNYPTISAPISNVERILRGDEVYYILSVDFDVNKDIDVRGDLVRRFSTHPKTYVTSSYSSGSDILNVDTTVGFPDSGELLYIDTVNDEDYIITYTSKSYTEFIGCSGAPDIETGTEIRINSYCFGVGDDGGEIRVSVLGVLSDLTVVRPNNYFKKNSRIKISSLGRVTDDEKSSEWIFNIPTSYDVERITLEVDPGGQYRVVTTIDNNIILGDSVELIGSDGITRSASVVQKASKNIINVVTADDVNLNAFYKVRKVIAKAKTAFFPDSTKYSTNVQNVYTDFDENVYITSPSIGNYNQQQLNIDNFEVSFDINVDNVVERAVNGVESEYVDYINEIQTINVTNHGFFTGDEVVYNPISTNNALNIQKGVYYVYKIDSNNFKLSRSKDNIYQVVREKELGGSDFDIIKKSFQFLISFTQSATNQVLYPRKFSDQSLNRLELQSQNIVRLLKNPTFDGEIVETIPGQIGILKNGVEITNYKSNDSIFYGGITKIDVSDGGSGYDVIDPPELIISDSVGTGATGYCTVVGQLDSIEIVDFGSNFLSTPVINITGGNGTGAVAEPNLQEVQYSEEFDSSTSLQDIDIINDRIKFLKNHKFITGEFVKYDNQDELVVGGLVSQSEYYVNVYDSSTITLHNTFSDAVLGNNKVNITSYGTGVQKITSINKKKFLTSINVLNSGENYSNNKVVVSADGIKSTTNDIVYENHGFKSGEIITYYPGNGSQIVGLSTIPTSYYVTSNDLNSFKLSEIGSGVGIASDFYYLTKQYIDIQGVSGNSHEFNYPPINVTVVGLVGLSTETANNFNVSVRPRFNGKITKINLESSGLNYGSEEIINYRRQPNVQLLTGSGAQAAPIVSSLGEIVDVLVTSQGKNYKSPPKINVSGDGFGAILNAVIENGALTSVFVVNGGQGYKQESTNITISETGSGAIFESSIKSWTINEVERSIESFRIKNDDSFPSLSISKKYGIAYTHLYAPRALRELLQGTKIDQEGTIYRKDIDNDYVTDSEDLYHSPILGWAYDGNPIYGPYGFSGVDSPGDIVRMQSGYEVILDPNRPNSFPPGFFVEDYVFTGDTNEENTILDEFNGRYCVTPEYPNGVYAYFSLINDTADSSSFFQGDRRPLFPYFIGNKFKSVPIEFNFDPKSEQLNFDISNLNVFRNTKPYGEEEVSANYDFYVNPARIREQINRIKSIQSSNVESILYVSRGDNYKVNDTVIFSDEQEVNISSGLINKVKGKTISTITGSSIELENSYFFPLPGSQNKFVGLTSSPHNLENNDFIEIKDTKVPNSFIDGKYKISTISNSLILKSNVDAIINTGIVTYFDVYNTDYSLVLPGDVYKVGDETIRILNVDRISNRVRVERNIESVVSLVDQHYPYDTLEEQSRKIVVDLNSNQKLVPDKTLFFNPIESLGLGQTFGVGITSTIYFSNPGVGKTLAEIPTRSIFFPNHGLETGDYLTYSPEGGTTIDVAITSTSSFPLTDLSELYAVRFSKDTVGLSSNKVGLSSDGSSYVGIGTDSNDILFFTSIGTGEKHRLLTVYDNILQASIIRNEVTVDTESDHNLLVGDVIDLSGTSGLSTTISISYNDQLSRTLTSPYSFSAAGINTATNSITIQSHGLKSGQKVIYKAISTPSVGLVDNQIYYIILLNSNEIKLSDSFYDSTSNNIISVDIDSQQDGQLYLINPPIELYKNQTVEFDLSSPSLAFGGVECFKFKIYSDVFFRDEFTRSPNSPNNFDVTSVGTIGQPGAKTQLTINDDTPNILYYNLVPINNNIIPVSKTNIFVDSSEVINNNTLIIKDSNIINKNHTITGITTRTFTFNISNTLEETQYTKQNSSFEYQTTSTNTLGPIGDVEISESNKSFSRLPKVKSIITNNGSGAILIPQSSTIGALKKGSSIDILDIGFDFSTDKTLRPIAFLPALIRVEALSSFDSIIVTSAGIGYNEKPDLVVLDGFTGEIVDDVELEYTDEGVDIKKNTKGLYNVTPTIIPTNNTNGVGISTITYDVITRDVVITLSKSYSNAADFPFEVGDKILVENITISTDPTDVFNFGSKGYNSSDYEYKLFTVTNIVPNIGGDNPTITYSLVDLDIGTGPGVYSSQINIGRVIPEKHFPVFEVKLKKNIFLFDEVVNSTTTDNTGIVEYWDKDNEYLSLFTSSDFKVGETIFGVSSGSIATIDSIIQSLAYYDVEASSIIRDGFTDEIGFLNERTQRIHDNEYYQYFSYSLNSQVPYEDWNPVVSDLNHTVGFRKFSDYVIESVDTDFVGIETSQNEGNVEIINNLDSVIDLETTSDFDLATEVSFEVNSKLISNEIIFNSIVLQDFSECIGNRVLNIDDISEEFNDSAIQNVVTSFPL